MVRLKSAGRDTGQLETEAREIRRSANRRSLMLAQNQVRLCFVLDCVCVFVGSCVWFCVFVGV